MHVHIKLNEILVERNLSHRQFAKMTGIRHPTISQMANNQTRSIPLENLAVICKVLNCDISDILELKKEQSD